MKDFPGFVTLKYYYSDKKTSDTFLFGESASKSGISGHLIGVLVLTEDGFIYFDQKGGHILPPDRFREERRIVPFEWLTSRGVLYAIEYQPYDFRESWWKNNSMYSKDFWHLVLSDIRDFSIKILLDDFKPINEWCCLG